MPVNTMVDRGAARIAAHLNARAAAVRWARERTFIRPAGMSKSRLFRDGQCDVSV